MKATEEVKSAKSRINKKRKASMPQSKRCPIRYDARSATIKLSDGQASLASIQVHRYEIKNIQPPQSVQDSMEKQLRAERERRAILAESEGDKQSRINRSEGYKTEIINTSEGEKQKRINEAEGRAAEIKAIANAMGQSIEMIANSIASPGGKESVKLGLTEKYLDSLGSIAKQEPEILLPMDLSNFKDIIASLGLEGQENE